MLSRLLQSIIRVNQPISNRVDSFYVICVKAQPRTDYEHQMHKVFLPYDSPYILFAESSQLLSFFWSHTYMMERIWLEFEKTWRQFRRFLELNLNLFFVFHLFSP
jgi:hypothetical protein